MRFMRRKKEDPNSKNKTKKTSSKRQYMRRIRVPK